MQPNSGSSSLYQQYFVWCPNWLPQGPLIQIGRITLNVSRYCGHNFVTLLLDVSKLAKCFLKATVSSFPPSDGALIQTLTQFGVSERIVFLVGLYHVSCVLVVSVSELFARRSTASYCPVGREQESGFK
jgi:hypothetical protein